MYHYGVYIDEHDPITGVISNRRIVEFIIEESRNAIDLDYVSHIANCPFYRKHGECDCLDFDHDNPTLLIGNWVCDNGKYQHDPNGQFAAIVAEQYTQVIFSKHTKRCNLCSPCYPGQGDLETPGKWLTYDLPEYATTE